MLRRIDFLALFDTAPDLSGADIDVAPYVRDAEDLDAQVAWATWTPEAATAGPPADAKAPAAEDRCRVPLRLVSDLAKTVRGVAAGPGARPLDAGEPAARARPGEVLLISAADGGYDPETGFDPSARGPVPGCPALDTEADLPMGAEDSYGADSANVQQRDWLSPGPAQRG